MSKNQLAPAPFAPVTPFGRPATLHSLPDDVLLLVICFIRVKDILSLRQTSRKFYPLTKLRWVWSDAMARLIKHQGLSIPAIDVDFVDFKAFSSSQLEARVVHASKFHDNWSSQHPKARRVVRFTADPPEVFQSSETQESCSVKQVLFLTGRNGEFLVTLAGGMITCWEVPLDGSRAYRVADWTANKDIQQVVANQDPEHCVDLAFWAYESRSNRVNIVSVNTLSLDAFHGKFTCHVSRKGLYGQITPLHAMHGDHLAMGETVCVFYHFGKKGNRAPLYALPHIPALPNANNVLTAKFIGDYLLIVRTRSIELHTVPEWSIEKQVFETYGCIYSSMLTESIANEAAIFARPRTDDRYHNWPTDSVSILSRCTIGESTTVRQYDLLPNLKKKEPRSPENKGLTSVEVLPFVYPAEYTRILDVAPSSCELHIGARGKGFWIQTRNVVTRHSEHPARCLIGFDITKARSEEGQTLQTVDPTAKREPRIVDNVLRVCEEDIYARTCSMGEVFWKKYSLVSADLEDTVGRIAVGDRDGMVEVLDYV